MEVLLLTDEADLESALPELESFAQSVQRAPLDDPGAAKGADADVAIIDARADLAAARRVCRRLTTSAPALAVVAVVAPANFVAVDGDWIFDDVLLNAAGGAELQARLRLAITRRRSTLAGTLQFGDLVLHPASYTASLGDRDLGLTLTEFKLMNFLVQHAGRAFTRTRLMREVWGYECHGRIRTRCSRTTTARKARSRARIDDRHRSRCGLYGGDATAAALDHQRIDTKPLQVSDL